jgi:hypothetical protein
MTRLFVGRPCELGPRSFPWPPAGEPERAPYRGLKALEADDAGVFFGRDAQLSQVLDRLHGARESGDGTLLAVLGASGNGKSSFLRAGLWPRLLREAGSFFPLRVIRPEDAPISGENGLGPAVVEAFARLGEQRSLEAVLQALDDGTDGLALLLHEMAGLARSGPDGQATDGRPPLPVILIDEAEELLQNEGTPEALRFAALIAETLTRPGSGAERLNAAALIAIRPERFELLRSVLGFGEVRLELVDLPPLAASELGKVIEGPAERVGAAAGRLAIDPAVSEGLIAEAQGTDALPLLAFTLEHLYADCAAKGVITPSDCEKLGGVRGSIDAAVKRALSKPSRRPAIPASREEQQGLLRRTLVPHLARIDAQSGMPMRRLARLDEISEEGRALVERLVKARLLIRDRRDTEEVVELAHECVLRHWPALSVWLAADADDAGLAETVDIAAEEWLHNGKREAWLEHRGERLASAERLLGIDSYREQLGENGAAYLAACRALETPATPEESSAPEVLPPPKMPPALEMPPDIETALAMKMLPAPEIPSAVERRTAEPAMLDPPVLLAEPGVALLDATSQIDGMTGRRPVLRGWMGWTLGWTLGFLAALLAIGVGIGVQRWQAALELQAANAREAARLAAAARQLSESEAALARDKAALARDAADVAKDKADVAGERAANDKLKASLDDREAGLAVERAALARERANLAGRLASLAELGGHREQALRFAILAARFESTGMPGAEASPAAQAALAKALQDSVWRVRLAGHEGVVNAASFSPDGSRVVSASNDKTARIFDAASGKEITVLSGHEGFVASAVFSPDGAKVLTASWDKTARIFDAASGQQLLALSGHADKVTSAAFSSDGTRIVTACADGTAHVFDAASGNEVLALRGNPSGLTSAAFSPDDSRIVTAALDGSVRMFEARTGRLVKFFRAHEDVADSVGFSRDGRRLVTASADKTARIFDALTGREILILRGHDGALHSALFNQDGTRIVTASSDKTARVFDVQSGNEIMVLRGHEDVVNSAAFSLDGSSIVTASADRTVRIWSASPASGTGPGASASSADALLRDACTRRLAGATLLTRDEMRLAGFTEDAPLIDVCEAGK